MSGCIHVYVYNMCVYIGNLILCALVYVFLDILDIVTSPNNIKHITSVYTVWYV